jgi:hypothetical protein
VTERIERTDLAQAAFDGVVGHHHGHGIDRVGLYADNPGLMRMASGIRIDPLDLQPADVNIGDIARSLSRQCRYNGHVGGFLSVARHSMWVAEWLQGAGEPPAVQLIGLLHDAAEAYLGDMVRPLKHRPEMAVFRDADEQAERAVASAFGLPHPWPQIVHDADRAITRTELDVHRDEFGIGAVFAHGYPRSFEPQYVVDEAEFTALFDHLTTELGR